MAELTARKIGRGLREVYPSGHAAARRSVAAWNGAESHPASRNRECRRGAIVIVGVHSVPIEVVEIARIRAVKVVGSFKRCLPFCRKTVEISLLILHGRSVSSKPRSFSVEVISGHRVSVKVRRPEAAVEIAAAEAAVEFAASVEIAARPAFALEILVVHSFRVPLEIGQGIDVASLKVWRSVVTPVWIVGVVRECVGSIVGRPVKWRIHILIKWRS